MPLPGSRSAAVPFILVTIFLDVLAFGIAIPVLPEIIRQMTEGSADLAARWTGLLMAGFAFMQFVFAPILGALSDRFGRRTILLASAFGAALDHLVVVFAPTVWWLLVGRMLCGVTAASFPVANAYIADITPPEHRARGFGLLGAALGLGFVLGPVIGGVLGGIDLRLPFMVAAGLAGLSFIYGFLVLPESLPAEHRRPFRWSQANPAASLLALRENPTVMGLAGTLVCLMLAFGVLQSVWVLSTAERFGWSPLENGLSLTLVGFATALVQGALLSPIVKRLGDRRTILGGIGTMLLAYVAYGLAPAGVVFCAAILMHTLGGVASPTMQGLITRSVDPGRQGAVQGAITSLNNLTFIAAPMIGAGLFAGFTGPAAALPLPGMPFLFGAASLGAAFLIARRVLGRMPVAVPAE